MKKLIAIGEALIDFIPSQSGRIQDIPAFEPHVGGAPCNVCGAFARLGGSSAMITQLGQDPFGDKIVDELQAVGVDTSLIARTAQANTSLAFVALQPDGNRQFCFFRNPGADMLMQPEQLQSDWFEVCGFLHFCSVSLGDFPMRQAHRQAIALARSHGALISFDPNIRLPLWSNPQACQDAVRDFLPLADIVKISNEELEFITGTSDLHQAKDILFRNPQTQLVLYTCGSQGAYVLTRDIEIYEPSFTVEALDTTGAGDGFIGSFLYQCAHDHIKDFSACSAVQLRRYLKASTAFCAASIQQKGAISSYPDTLTE